MIKRELGVFLFVGVLTVLIDFVAYRSLIYFETVHVGIAKGFSFLCGTFFAYVANRFWTFGHTAGASGTRDSGWRFVVLYSTTLLVNVLVNSLVLGLFVNEIFAVQFAFLSATGVSATLNFLGMKFFVFRSSVSSLHI